MKVFRIDTVGTAHEAYAIEAESEAEAREKFERGEITGAIHSEVEDCEIVRVQEMT